MANQIKSVAQMVLENKGKETRKRKADELTFKKSLASQSNSINKTIHDKKVKVKAEKRIEEMESSIYSIFSKHIQKEEAKIGRLFTQEEVNTRFAKFVSTINKRNPGVIEVSVDYSMPGKFIPYN